ncbi:MAG: uracil phosphoribosyltransferase, partial [Verrucomicrobiales bacterium]
MSHPSSQVTVVDHPLIQVRLAKLRAEDTSLADFRSRLQEIAQLMTFEVTRNFEVKPIEVRTPIAVTTGYEPARPLILVPILRAGIGMLDGILEVLPEAQIGHIGMFRNEETHRPESYYCKLPPNIADADVLLIDPMLATGHSGAEAAKQLRAAGARRIHFICLVACPEGVEYFVSENPDVPIYTAAIDSHLNENA